MHGQFGDKLKNHIVDKMALRETFIKCDISLANLEG